MDNDLNPLMRQTIAENDSVNELRCEAADYMNAIQNLQYVIISMDKNTGQYKEITESSDEVKTLRKTAIHKSLSSRSKYGYDVMETSIDDELTASGPAGRLMDPTPPVDNGTKGFPVNAEISIMMKYQPGNRVIMGSIWSDKGLCDGWNDISSYPQLVYFHISVQPEDKHEKCR